jgi:hypothetical protein
MVEPALSFAAWLQTGIEAGYCSEAVCNTHDGLPSTPEEDAEWEDGGDPCVPAVRLMWSMEIGQPAEP